MDLNLPMPVSLGFSLIGEKHIFNIYIMLSAIWRCYFLSVEMSLFKEISREKHLF